MQLILNTDTDIGIQKMATIKQDSIEEKFSNNSLIEKVCNEITTSNNECIKSQELIVQVCESIETDERLTENINIETIIDEENNGYFKQCEEECDKQQEKDNENSKTENKQSEICKEYDAIEDMGMQYDENSDILSKSVTLDKDNITVQPNEIDMSETNVKQQQDIIQTGIKNKVDEPSEEETKMEENIKEELKICAKINDSIEEQNNQDTKIEMEIGERDTVQAGLEEKIEELQSVSTEIEDKIEEESGGNTKIKETTEDQNEVNTKIEENIKEQNEVSSKIENEIKEQNGMKTEIEDKIAEKNHVVTENQELNTIRNKMGEKYKEDIKIVKDNDEQTTNISNIDAFRDSCKLQDEVQSYSNNIKDETEKPTNTEIVISVQDKPSNVKDYAKQLNQKIDEIQDQRMYDKVEDKAMIEEGKCIQNMDIEEGYNILKLKVNDSMSSNIEEQLENNDEIKENIKEQELLKEDANVSTEQLDSIQTNADCDLNKMKCDQHITQAPSKTEVRTEIENNKINDEQMDVDLEQSPDLQNTNNAEDDKISSNSNSKATESEADEVIDIADEKDEDFECIISQDMQVIENKVEHTIIEKENVSIDKNFESVLGIDIKENEATAKISELNSIEPVKYAQEDTEHDEESLHKAIEKSPEIDKIVKEKKKLTHICKLSNTLDILSDEDEDSLNEESQKGITDTAEKQCIHIEDDDDIMLIDEESNSKDSINKLENLTETTNDFENEQCKVDLKDKKEYSFNISLNEDVEAVEKQTINETLTSKLEDDKGVEEEKQTQQKPLLPVNFLRTCKKNLADMTRDELEEFCILKIVESVVDRSNLSEIKSQLKSLAQNIEEYRKKASTLTKQNRDLQVVLKSVQEEQKKKSNLPITPLKITRSVGMQVLMTDKTTGMRKKTSHVSNTSQNNVTSNSAPNRSGKGQGNQNSKYQKIQTSISPIPVPRLVPAANITSVTNMKIQPPNVSTQCKASSATTVQVPPVPNGIAVSPTPKPEKRSHNQMQQNNSVTVDLTDDEPPAKVIQRNIAPPVRLVPPQNLLAAHRQPFGTNINSPRKVYIPISGSQNHTVGVRPGQTIMLKTISPHGPRQRCPAPAGKINQNVNTVRMQRLPNRHPAPLPDSMKQYQPPNWKTLPPAPELNLSKVDNGIVISWKIEEYHEDEYEEIASYQLYAYQETSSPPSTALWKKIGDVKALPLPMACTLTQFMPGYKYYFAVRAVDVRSRLGPFSLPGSILLLNKI